MYNSYRNPPSAVSTAALRSGRASVQQRPALATSQVRARTPLAPARDLSSTRPRGATGRVGSATGDYLAPAPPLRAAAGELERDYVANLQQQVFFLEQQGRIMRSKLAEPGPEVVSRSVSADPLLNPELDGAAPLNDHIRALKEKYVLLARESEENQRKQAEELEELKKTVRGYQNEIDQSRQAAADAAAAAAAQAAAAAAVQHELLAEAETAHGVATAAERASADLRADVAAATAAAAAHRAEAATLRTEVAELRSALAASARSARAPSEVEATLKRVAAAEVAANDALAELENERARASALEAELTVAKDAAWTLERDLEGTKSALRTATRAQETAEAEADRARDNAAAARGALETVETEVRRLRREVDTLRAAGRGAGDGGRDARVQAEMARQTAARAELELAEAQKELAAARAATEAALARASDLEAERDGLLRRIETVAEESAAGETARVEAVAAARAAEAEAARARGAAADAKAALSGAMGRVAELEAERALMREKVAVKADLEQIAPKLAELADLRSSSKEIGSLLSRLAGRLENIERGQNGDMDDTRSVFSDRTVSTHAVRDISQYLSADAIAALAARRQVGPADPEWTENSLAVGAEVAPMTPSARSPSVPPEEPRKLADTILRGSETSDAFAVHYAASDAELERDLRLLGRQSSWLGGPGSVASRRSDHESLQFSVR